MAIYLRDKKAKAFKGHYKPVNIYQGSKKIAGYKFETKTGEHLQFEDTYNDVADLQVFGKSEQIQTEQGKNLFDANEFINNLKGNGYETVENDDTYADGIKLTEIVNVHQRSTYLAGQLSPNTQYTLSVAGSLSEYTHTNANLLFAFRYTDGSRSDYMVINRIYAKKTIVSEVGKTVDYIYVTRQYDGTAIIGEIQLELGSTATAYEPFIPTSPSPEYPSPIISVGDDGGFDIVSAGKNLFNVRLWLSLTGNTNYYETDEDGRLKQKAPDFRDNSQLPTFTLPEGTYVRSGIVTASSRFMLNGVIVGSLFTVKSGDVLAFKSWMPSGSVLGFFQIEVGSTATPYTPFRGMQTIHCPYALRSSPDGTSDTLDMQRIGTMQLDGTETYNQIATENPNFNRFYTHISGKAFELGQTVCTHFKNDGTSSNGGGLYSMSDRTNNTALSFAVPKSVTTETEMQAYMASIAPVTLVYKLAIPIIRSKPVIPTYYPYTQIYTTNTELKPQLTAQVRTIEK